MCQAKCAYNRKVIAELNTKITHLFKFIFMQFYFI